MGVFKILLLWSVKTPTTAAALAGVSPAKYNFKHSQISQQVF